MSNYDQAGNSVFDVVANPVYDRSCVAETLMVYTKTIHFYETILPSDTPDLIAKLALHIDEIMANGYWYDPESLADPFWNYLYNWDTHPTWNYANGSEFNGQAINEGQYCGSSGYSVDATGTIDYTVPQMVHVWFSWTLYTISPIPVSIYQCGCPYGGFPRFIIIKPSASILWSRYDDGDPYPWYNEAFGNSTEHVLISTSVENTPPPADINGVAPGCYLATPMPEYLGVFDVTDPDGQLFGETNFQIPNRFTNG